MPVMLLLLAVFSVSGASGLIYQVAWQRMLTLHYGVGAVSVTLIVSAWMLGLGVGSAVGGRLADASDRPWLLYAGAETALAVCGVLSLPLLASLGGPALGIARLPSFIVLFALLCVPTALMGTTLPALASVAHRVGAGFLPAVARLYFANTAGAAVGALLSGYVLVSWLGLAGAVILAAVLNVLLAATVLWMAPRLARAKPVPPLRDAQREHGPSADASAGWSVALLVLAAGFLAIGYEITWYRLVGFLVKDSPYAFSSVLAVYLVGIALGSLGAGWFLARRPGASRHQLCFALQFLVGLSSLVLTAAFYHLSTRQPLLSLVARSFASDVHPPVDWLAAVGSSRPGVVLAGLDVFLWPALFVLLPTILMGACFPAMASLVFARRPSAGSAVGGTYALMVAGNVLGALVTAFVLLPSIGTERTLLIFTVVGLLLGLGLRPGGVGGRRALPLRASVVALAAAAAVLFPARGRLYLALHRPPFEPARATVREGVEGVVVTFAGGGRVRTYINGQGHGYRPGPLFAAEAIEALAHAALPRRVLVVGFGAGSTLETVLRAGEVQHVVLAELCGPVIESAREIPSLDGILRDPRLRIVIDDARRFLAGTNDRFDAMLMDPLRTTTAYSNNLHSKQSFQLAARRLTAGGVLLVGGLGDGHVVARTLLDVFPYVRAYPGFCLASSTPLARDDARMQRLLAALPPAMRADVAAFSEDWLEGAPLAEATAAYRVNEDWRPVSEYYLGPQTR